MTSAESLRQGRGRNSEEAGGQRGCTRAQLETEQVHGTKAEQQQCLHSAGAKGLVQAAGRAAHSRGRELVSAPHDGRHLLTGKARRECRCQPPRLSCTGAASARVTPKPDQHHECPARCADVTAKCTAQRGPHPHSHVATQVKTGRANRWHRETAQSNTHTGPPHLRATPAAPGQGPPWSPLPRSLPANALVR